MQSKTLKNWIMAIPKSFTAQIDIVAVVSNFILVKRAGINYKACCPFHNEKTASFTINKDKGNYYCFGCHAKGSLKSKVPSSFLSSLVGGRVEN